MTDELLTHFDLCYVLGVMQRRIREFPDDRIAPKIIKKILEKNPSMEWLMK